VSADLGAEAVLDPASVDIVSAILDLTGGHGAHASVDAAGSPAAFHAAMHGTRVDGNVVVVAIHENPLVIAPFDLLMPEVRVTGVAMFCDDFPIVIEQMSRGVYPTRGWVSTIPFDGLLEQGFEALHRQEGLKLLVDVGNVRDRA
jgi:(R,R)-butanediol dehydrogenase/meso-butanediol dehydrogenase/diacetyl reductase